MEQSEAKPTDQLIPASKAAVYFGVTRRTIARWIDHPTLGFPRPVEINGRLYLKASELESWTINQAKRSRD